MTGFIPEEGDTTGFIPVGEDMMGFIRRDGYFSSPPLIRFSPPLVLEHF
jgi:hypothetical protein